MTTAAPRIPLHGRINLRAVAFAAVVLLVLGYPFYRLIDARLHPHGRDKKDGVGEFTEINLKHLTDFSMDQFKGTDEDIPRQWRAMNGKRVLLVGEMVTGRSMVGIDSDFDLVYTISRGSRSQPQVQWFVKCKVLPGMKVEHASGLVAVKGTLHVGVTRSDDRIASVYRVDVEAVEPQ